jgi:hypothetical protein
MQRLLTAALVLTGLLSAQQACAEDTAQTTVAAIQQQTATPAPEPIVISWDRVGSREKGWV